MLGSQCSVVLLHGTGCGAGGEAAGMARLQKAARPNREGVWAPMCPKFPGKRGEFFPEFPGKGGRKQGLVLMGCLYSGEGKASLFDGRCSQLVCVFPALARQIHLSLLLFLLIIVLKHSKLWRLGCEEPGSLNR